MTNLELNLLVTLVILLLCFFKFFFSAKEQLKDYKNTIQRYHDLNNLQSSLIDTKEQTISELEETIDSLQLQITSLTNMNKMLGSAPPSFVEDDSIVVESFKQRAARHKVVFTAKQKQRIREAYLQNLSNKKYTLVKLVEMLNKEFGLDKPYNYYRNIWKENQ